jgi:hypothetical protein
VELAVGPGPLPLELLKTVVDPEPPLGAFDEKPNVKVNLDINTHREFVKSIIISLSGMDLASECGRSAAFR